MSSQPTWSNGGAQFTSMIQLIALCPLLAVSDTVTKAIGISAALLIVVPLTAAAAPRLRRWLDDGMVLAATVLVLAATIACVELLGRAWFADLRSSLGMFLPLIVTNAALIGALVDRDQSAGGAVRRALVISLGMSATLLILGIARELVGRGSLLYDAGLMLGSWARPLQLHAFPVELGFLLAMLPPGAFFALGLLIAARNGLAGDGHRAPGSRGRPE